MKELKNITMILTDFAKQFAFQEDDGTWWGFDTNLGNQKRRFTDAEKAINRLFIGRVPSKRQHRVTPLAVAHQNLGYNLAIDDTLNSFDNLATPKDNQ